MSIIKKKLSELPESQSLDGLWTLGKDAGDRSVKVPLTWLKNAADGVSAATSGANTAAGKATAAATAANTAKEAAATAAGSATSAAGAATDATTAALAATKLSKAVVNNPAYIGEDYYVYIYDLETEGYVKSDLQVPQPADGTTPQLSMGTVTDGETASAALSQGEDDANGNPTYSLNLTLPKGAKGDAGKTPQFSIGEVAQGETTSATITQGENDANGNPTYTLALTLEKGVQGDTGKTPQFTIGEVTQGESAAASITQGENDANGNPTYTLNLTFVKGDQGETGKVPQLSVDTVTTGAAGSDATVTMTEDGTDSNGNPKYKLSFAIPKGADGLGAGNVLVAVPDLQASKQYLFKPSTDGSAEGTFVEYTSSLNAAKEYTNTQIAAIPTPDVSGQIATHNTSESAHSDIRSSLTTLATKDGELQNQIDAIVARSDVVDIVETKADLDAYFVGSITENDIVKVLADESHDNAKTYYRLVDDEWEYVGSEGEVYSKGQADAKFVQKDGDKVLTDVNFTEAKSQQLDNSVSQEELTEALEGAGANIVYLSQAEYDALVENNELDEDVFYATPDADESDPPATQTWVNNKLVYASQTTKGMARIWVTTEDEQQVLNIATEDE